MAAMPSGSVEETKVTELPDCDICKIVDHCAALAGTITTEALKKAAYDGKTTIGPWAYMCPYHFGLHGMGLGLGRGQKLVLLK